MKPGARGVLVMVHAPEGDNEDAWTNFTRAIKETLEKGLVLKSEVVHMKGPAWYCYSDADFFAPILSAGFDLEAVEKYQVADPFKAELDATGNRAVYAERVTGWYRSFSEPTLAAAVAPERRDAAMTAIYGRLQQLIEAECIEKRGWIDPSYRLVAIKK